MHQITLRTKSRFSWQRSGALASAFAVHSAALLLIMAPVAPPPANAKAPSPETVVTIMIPPPPQPPPPPPPPPEPERLPRAPVVDKVPAPPPTPPPVPPLDTAEVATLSEPPLPPSGPTEPAQALSQPPSTDIRYTTRIPPRYPAMALRQRHEGTVVLLVLVGVDGMPREIRVKTSSGHAELDRAARETAAKWRFTPGSEGGAPIEAWALVPITFRLNSF